MNFGKSNVHKQIQLALMVTTHFGG